MELSKSNKYGSRLPKRPPCKETIAFFRAVKGGYFMVGHNASDVAGAQMSRGPRGVWPLVTFDVSFGYRQMSRTGSR